MAGDSSVSVIVCLGNPGSRYALTRHNMGWWVGDILAEGYRIRFEPGRGRFFQAQVRIKDSDCTLLKPTTFMNASGQAVLEFIDLNDVPLAKIAVVTDDIVLPLGQLRIRASGSSGGHNGLGSIIEVLGSEDFTRIRCGVGPAPAAVDPADFVLAPFEESEVPLAREMAGRAAEAVRVVVTDGVRAAANLYNRLPPAPDSSPEDDAGADRPREGK